MLENIGKATNKNPLIYASPKNFANAGPWALAAPPFMAYKSKRFLLLFFKKEALASFSMRAQTRHRSLRSG
jgi:hypothetical protein